jgi:hypothetical protein
MLDVIYFTKKLLSVSASANVCLVDVFQCVNEVLVASHTFPFLSKLEFFGQAHVLHKCAFSTDMIALPNVNDVFVVWHILRLVENRSNDTCIHKYKLRLSLCVRRTYVHIYIYIRTRAQIFIIIYTLFRFEKLLGGYQGSIRLSVVWTLL